MSCSILQTSFFFFLLSFGMAFGQSCVPAQGIQGDPNDCSCCTYSGGDVVGFTLAKTASSCQIFCFSVSPAGVYGFRPVLSSSSDGSSSGGVCECRHEGTLEYLAGSFAGANSLLCNQGIEDRPDLASCTCCGITGGTPVATSLEGTETECQQTCDSMGADYYDFFFHDLSASNEGECRCLDGGALEYQAGSIAGTTSGMSQSGVIDDSHITKWNGDKFEFQGESDLVLLRARDFAEGLGLHVHIRTTLQDSVSHIEEAAIKAGKYVANVNHQGVWIHHQLLNTFPAQYGHFRITKDTTTTDKNDKAVVIYEISVAGHRAVRITMISTVDTQFLSVAVLHHSQSMMSAVQNFETSQGLMGQYRTGKALGRDGWTELVDMNQFAMEWQVQPYEKMLFMAVRKHVHNNLSMKQSETKSIVDQNPDLHAKAEVACGHVDAVMFEFCVQDVITTGDVSVAASY